MTFLLRSGGFSIIYTHRFWRSSIFKGRWEDTNIRDILNEVFATYQDDERITLRGGDVQLGADFTRSLYLILHELITNATKYGALSTEDGRILLQWNLDESKTLPQLCIEWTESEGPNVQTPSDTGYGSKLIDLLLKAMKGEITYDFKTGGLHVRLQIPITEKTSVEQ